MSLQPAGSDASAGGTENVMNTQTQLEKILSRLTPEYFAEKVIPGAINVLVILILMMIALRISKMLSTRVWNLFQKRKGDLEFQKRADTLSAVIRNALNFTIVSVSLVMILGELRINIGPVIATAGIVGLAVGFGAQTLVQDVISGFFILLEEQVRVGDVVEIAGKSGLVEKVDLRMTTLRDMSGNVHYVRHGKIDVVTNMTKDYSNSVYDIPVAYHTDIDRVLEVIRNVDRDLCNDPGFKDDILNPIEVLGVDRFAESAIFIKARTKTKPIKQWRVAREFNRRLKKAFDEEKIEMPFQQVAFYVARDVAGSAPLSGGPARAKGPREDSA
jgi:moderate conductance mechanosensitive channel